MVTEVTDAAAGSLRGDDATYSGYRRAGIRLSEPTDPLLTEARRGAEGFRDFSRGLQLFDEAHVVMLAEEGIIPREGAAACLRTLREMDEAGVEHARAELNVGLHGGEAYLIRRLGMEAGGLVHAGRSSWDLTRVAHRVRLREELLIVADALNAYRGAVLAKADEHVETVMPYYTHGQQGQPTTFAHQLHGFACAAERDFERLSLAYAHMNVSPAGSAAGSTTRFRTNRERVAELLGFDAVSTNSRDSSYNYDHNWEMAAALACLAATLGGLADELILWMGIEFDLVRIADRFCGTSSIMTQKRNPTAAEHIQAVRTKIAGRIPTSYTARELIEASGEAAGALRLAAGIVATLAVNVEHMRERTAASWAQASDLAGALVEEQGLPWRMAHQIVGIMVRLAEEEGVPPGRPTPELLDRAAVLFLGQPLGVSAESMARALDPTACVERRQITGSPGPSEMRRQIAASRDRLTRDMAALGERRERLAAAGRKLTDAMAAITG
jgi:argininosuccinate lyase